MTNPQIKPGDWIRLDKDLTGYINASPKAGEVLQVMQHISDRWVDVNSHRANAYRPNGQWTLGPDTDSYHLANDEFQPGDWAEVATDYPYGADLKVGDICEVTDARSPDSIGVQHEGCTWAVDNTNIRHCFPPKGTKEGPVPNLSADRLPTTGNGPLTTPGMVYDSEPTFCALSIEEAKAEIEDCEVFLKDDDSFVEEMRDAVPQIHSTVDRLECKALRHSEKLKTINARLIAQSDLIHDTLRLNTLGQQLADSLKENAQLRADLEDWMSKAVASKVEPEKPRHMFPIGLTIAAFVITHVIAMTVVMWL